MTPDDFVHMLKSSHEHVVASSLEELRKPPGRAPWETSLRVSQWFNSLPQRDQGFVSWCLSLGAYSAIFSLLAKLDRVSFFDAYPHAELRLVYVTPDGQETVLNADDAEELHALWTNAVFPYGDPLPQ